MSQIEYALSFSLVLYFIDRVRIASRYVEESSDQLSDTTLMAKDSMRMNLIRIHSGLHRNSQFKDFKELLPWGEFTAMRNKLAYDIKNIDESRGFTILFELLIPLERIVRDLIKAN